MSNPVDYFSFFENEIEIKVDRNDYNVFPEEYDKLYSQENLKVGPLTFVSFTSRTGNDKQLIEFENYSKSRFILKRISKQCQFPINEEAKKKLLQEDSVKQFINNSLKEYVICRIMLAHPSGILPINFRIVFLKIKDKIKETSLIVSEFLMEKGGDSLLNSLKDQKSKIDFLTYLSQLCSSMEYMEKQQVYHCDIKLNNCLVDNKGHFKLIDYDISQADGFYSYSTQTSVNHIEGFSGGFVAPEIYQKLKGSSLEENIKDLNINPWKADVYSCGILALFLSKILDVRYPNFLEFDKYKLSENEHLKIIKNIKSFKYYNDEKLNEKIQVILENCLSYKPKDRVTFKQLNQLLSKIKNSKINANIIKQEITNYQKINADFLTKDQLISQKRESEKTISDLKQKLSDQSIYLAKIEEKYEKIKNDYRTLEEKYNESKKENEELIFMNNELCVQNENQAKTNIENASKYEKVHKKLEISKKQIDELNSALELTQKANQDLIEKVAGLEEQLKHSQKQLEEPKTQKVELDLRLENTQTTNLNLIQKITCLEEKLKNTQTERDQYLLNIEERKKTKQQPY